MEPINRHRPPPENWPQQRSEESSLSGLDPAYCLQRAQLLLGLFRKDEASNPEIYAGGIAAILQDYPREIVDRATDPRTGIATRCKFGLPNPADVKEFCDDEAARLHRMSRPPIRKRSQPFGPPSRRIGEVSYTEFQAMADRGEVKPRPIGYFEKG